MPGNETPSAEGSSGDPGRSRVKRRSRKACQHCHVRKIRCNVAECGVPCTNCVDAATVCVIRRRKNQRADASLTDINHNTLEQTQNWRVAPSNSDWRRPSLQPAATPIERHTQMSPPNLISPQPGWTESRPEMYWQHNAVPQEQQQIADTASSGNGSCDFSHLIDLDDIFTFTGNNALPDIPPINGDLCLQPPYMQQDLGTSLMQGTNVNGTPKSSVYLPLQHLGLSSTDQAYLHGQGCLQLPPPSTFRHLMHLYFRMVHPNLPIVAEDEFWSCWNGDDFRLGEYSLLLVRAMIFAAISYAEPEFLANMDLMTKRDARKMYYRQTKLLFDFGVERDPLIQAQTCLLLTYHAPNYNKLRINSGWLCTAIRFAKIERADSYHRIQDPVRSRLLKRLWWGVLFRDRILSLGLRRSTEATLDSSWNDESHVLHLEDFRSELGKSHVHDQHTQIKIVEVITATCRLMQVLDPALDVLYRDEGLDNRLETAARSPSNAVKRVKDSMEGLRHWHDQAIRSFPFPVSLDDAPQAICIYANMMFCYYASAILALNLYLMFIYECCRGSKSHISVEEARDHLIAANDDLTKRTQELVQVRLAKYLPISASALMALPMFLQAINVAAARGSGMESTETRRLDVFRRMQESQQANFDESDFCADVLSNVVAYAQDDEKFVSSMTNWRDSKDGGGSSMSGSTTQNKVKLDWANLVHKRPRLLLRLVLYLDQALCTGGPPREEDFPAELRKDAA